MTPGPLHALVSGGVPAQHGALVSAGDGHRFLQKRAVVGAQGFILQTGCVFIQDGRLADGIENRLAGLGLVACHVGHRPHPPLEEGGHLGVHGVNFGARLL